MKPYYQIRVLIADDHEMVREGLRLMSAKIAEIEIIGEACNGEELIAMTKELKPDVVLTDVKMPKGGGVSAIAFIKEELPHIGVIALSSFDEPPLVMEVLNAGANGYLLKNASKEEITAAVVAAYKDERFYCKDIQLQLAHMIARGGKVNETKKVKDLFTEREIEVIEMICDELSSKQIADRLNLKTRTVERYRDGIMAKMDVRNVAGVVKFAIKHGLYTNFPK